MVRYSGLDARLGNCSLTGGIYNQEMVGEVEEFEASGQGETYTVPDLGNYYNRGLEASLVRPELSMTYHPQNTSFLHNYLISQTGTAPTATMMSYFANSADQHLLTGALVSRVEVECDRNGPVTVRANMLGLNWSTGLNNSWGNYSKTVGSTPSQDPLNITYVGLYDGAVQVRDLSTLWRRWNFAIDYGARHIHTGTGIQPTDVLPGVKGVSGTIECSLTNASNFMQYVMNGSVLNVHIGCQWAPMSSHYVFYSSVIRANAIRVPGVDVERVRVEFESKYVTRSSL